MDNAIDLFGSDADKFQPPSKDKQPTDFDKELMSEGLDRAIQGDTVLPMMIPQDAVIAYPNFILDLTKVDELNEFQMEAIDALLHPDGDTTIYAYTKGGLAKLGRGKMRVLDRVLTISIASLFHSKCRVIRDFVIGKPIQVVSEKDITTMRLSI